MNHWFFFCMGLIAGLCITPNNYAQEPKVKTSLDTKANPKLLDTYFYRYGCEPLKHIRRRKEWVQIVLPREVDDQPATQTGVYSYFSLSGDFEIKVRYHCGTIPSPKSGYGMSCGIALDTNGPEGTIAFTRNFSQEEGGSGYAVTRSIPVDEEMKHETQIFPTKARNGRLAFRRTGNTITCLAADGKKTFKELCQIEFTDSTVHQVRLYADPGGAKQPLNMWVGSLQVEAKTISGVFPAQNQTLSWWWILLGIVVLGTVTALLIRNHYRSKNR